jgi:hypothetical protein
MSQTSSITHCDRHSYIPSFLPFIILSFVHSFVHLLVSVVHLFNHWFIQAILPSFVCWFMHLFMQHLCSPRSGSARSSSLYEGLFWQSAYQQSHVVMQIRRPNNYDYNIAVTLGFTEPNPVIDLNQLEIVRTVVQDSPNKLFIGGLPCEWNEDKVSHAWGRPNHDRAGESHWCMLMTKTFHASPVWYSQLHLDTAWRVVKQGSRPNLTELCLLCLLCWSLPAIPTNKLVDMHQLHSTVLMTELPAVLSQPVSRRRVHAGEGEVDALWHAEGLQPGHGQNHRQLQGS